jgi:hypothetical protein
MQKIVKLCKNVGSWKALVALVEEQRRRHILLQESEKREESKVKEKKRSLGDGYSLRKFPKSIGIWLCMWISC